MRRFLMMMVMLLCVACGGASTDSTELAPLLDVTAVSVVTNDVSEPTAPPTATLLPTPTRLVEESVEEEDVEETEEEHGHEHSDSVVTSTAACDAFMDNTTTRCDDDTLYIESDGLPTTHNMMVGIISWQQQVPLPQPYIDNNAWQIPLNPVLSDNPISGASELFRGAIALAVNGVPIFNALNNRGDDAYLAGELDEWGGHSGRGDDYHYHTAPLHLQASIGSEQPIAYGLDGFPIYGLTEPDGSAVVDLDQYNGHFDSEGAYHYHATETYPYINGGMRGVVTYQNGQVEPQPAAQPIRPAGEPLRGAEITAFSQTATDAYSLQYTLNNAIYTVNYRIVDDTYFFEFVDPAGNVTEETYTAGTPPPAQPARDAVPPPRSEGEAPIGDNTDEVVSESEDVLEADSQTFQIEAWSDNWFAAYLEEALVVEDSVSITTERSFNSETATFEASYPLHLNFILKDFKENDTGLEYIGARNQQMGDGGFIMQLTDTSTGNVIAVSDDSFVCTVIHTAPLDKSCESESNPVAGTAPCTFEELAEPDGWMAADYDDSSWTDTTIHSAADVDPKQGYDDVSWDVSAAFVWGPDLETNNTVLCRLTINS